jgi:hypothetical protein
MIACFLAADLLFDRIHVDASAGGTAPPAILSPHLFPEAGTDIDQGSGKQDQYTYFLHFT